MPKLVKTLFGKTRISPSQPAPLVGFAWAKRRRWLVGLLAAALSGVGGMGATARAAPVTTTSSAKAKPAPKGKRRTAKRRPAKRRPTKRRPAKRSRRTKGKREKPKPRLPKSEAGVADEARRRQLRGIYPDHIEGPATRRAALADERAADERLFPKKLAPVSNPWPFTVDQKKAATGGKTAKDDAWLRKLKMPDFRTRLDPSVVKYLKHYKTARGGRLLASYIRKSGRYRQAMGRLLKAQKLPQDLMWLSMIESAFDSTIHSHAGAAGLWQFMPATGRIYGLTVTRKVDERLDPERATMAALGHLKDLYQRFGSWELAFGAYNMGYGGLLSSIRKYNTNDYWALRNLEGGLPYETALYVPKIVALAIAAKNCKIFKCTGVKREAALPFGDQAADKVAAAPGVSLEDVARAVDVDIDTIKALNPHVGGRILPPLENASIKRANWTVYVPPGKGKTAATKVISRGIARRLATYEVPWGFSISRIATAFETSKGKLRLLNDLYPTESPRPGTVLLVPGGRPPHPAAHVIKADKHAAAATLHRAPTLPTGARRVFYEVVFGDTVEDIARAIGVTAADVRKWNRIDRHAQLQQGMFLQILLKGGSKPAKVVLYEEKDLRILAAESDVFHAHHLSKWGYVRIQITVRAGDSWKKLAKRYGTSKGRIERTNHRSRYAKLKPGESLIVYAKKSHLSKSQRDTLEARDRKLLAPTAP